MSGGEATMALQAAGQAKAPETDAGDRFPNRSAFLDMFGERLAATDEAPERYREPAPIERLPAGDRRLISAAERSARTIALALTVAIILVLGGLWLLARHPPAPRPPAAMTGLMAKGDRSP